MDVCYFEEKKIAIVYSKIEKCYTNVVQYIHYRWKTLKIIYIKIKTIEQK